MSATTTFLIWCEEKYGKVPEGKKEYAKALKDRTEEQKKELGDMIYREIEGNLRVVDSPKIDSENRIIHIGKIQIKIVDGK